MTSAVTKRRAFLFYCLLTALLFGRSLNYGFVYDDDWRIYRNPAVQQIQPLSSYFLNPESQAGRTMEGHTYRPLVTLIYAAMHSVAGMKATWYRLLNFLMHSVNATLVFVIGIEILALSPVTAFFAGVFFLIHPVQVETVVWVSELSNILALTWILCGLLSWKRYRNSGHTRWVIVTVGLALLGFATRENSVCFLPILIAYEAMESNNSIVSRRRIVIALSILTLLTFIYVGVRTHLLHRFAQASLWGPTVATHIANVVQIWPLYWGRLIWPHQLRIFYSTVPILTSAWHWRALVGLFSFGFYLLLTGLAWKKDRRWGFALTAFVIFWIPSSNIVPLNILFAERLMYGMLACAGWWIGLALQRTSSRKAILATVTYLLVIAFVTHQQVPVWRNEETLWAQAVNIEPRSWFVWGCLGNANELLAAHQTDPMMIKHFDDRAIACYLRALSNNPTPDGVAMIKTRLNILKTQDTTSSN